MMVGFLILVTATVAVSRATTRRAITVSPVIKVATGLCPTTDTVLQVVQVIKVATGLCPTTGIAFRTKGGPLGISSVSFKRVQAMCLSALFFCVTI